MHPYLPILYPCHFLAFGICLHSFAYPAHACCIIFEFGFAAGGVYVKVQVLPLLLALSVYRSSTIKLYEGQAKKEANGPDVELGE